MEQGLLISEIQSEGTKEEKQEQLLRLLRAKKAALGLSDLFYFCKYILGYKDFDEEPHRKMCHKKQYSKARHRLNLEPRGCFKTTITIGWVIWRIIQNPNLRIMIDCEDLNLSKKILGEIKTHFETNAELIRLYGDFVTGSKKWSEHEVVVNKRTAILKDPTINTSSLEVNRVGAHVDILIEDDLHSLLNTQNPEQIDKVIQHWKLNGSILDPGGEEEINGTRWAVKDLYGVIIEQEKNRRKEGNRKYAVSIKDAETSGKKGGLYFPSRLTKEYLKDKKIEQGSYVYSCQYKNNPVDPDAVIFKPIWIRFYGRYAPDNLVITGTLDPAIGEKDENCYSNINVIGTDMDGYMYLLDNYRFRANPGEIIDSIFSLHEKWNFNEFGIETVAFQKALMHWMWERMRNSGIFVPIKELKTETRISKDLRIRALIPYIESGTIQFPGTNEHSLVGGMLDLYTEMTTYPVGEFRDALDSLAYQLQLYTPARKNKAIKTQELNFEQKMQEERRARVRKKKRDQARFLSGKHRMVTGLLTRVHH